MYCDESNETCFTEEVVTMEMSLHIEKHGAKFFFGNGGTVGV
jgi:hypothetical protein